MKLRCFKLLFDFFVCVIFESALFFFLLKYSFRTCLDYYFGNVYLSFDEGNKPDEDDIEDLKHFNFYSKQLESEFEIEDLDTCISISKDSLEEIFLKENFLNEVFDEKTCSKLKGDLRLSIVNCLKKVYRSEI